LENSQKIDVTYIIIFGSLGMLILVAFIILFVVLYQKRRLEHKNEINEAETKHQKKLLEASIEVAEKERQKIATNIHDDVGIVLNVIKLNISRMERNKDDVALVEELLKNNATLLEETINTIRSISHDLMPQSLLRLGYVKGINELCHKINTSGAQTIQLVSDGNKLVLSKKIEMQLYRLTKEILNNIIKHSSSTHIIVNISILNNTLSVLISHNGKGITDNEVTELIESGNGIGLQSIYSRAQLTGSQIHYQLKDNEYQVQIITPISI
jgi:two-component system NarL family sensor kinase